MQATAQKSFIEMLEDEIRTDLRNEVRQEIEAEVLKRFGRGLGLDQSVEQAPSQAVHAASRLETWLASNMGRTTFARSQAAARSYNVKPAAPSAAKPAQAKPDQPAQIQARPVASLFTPKTTEELVAIELLTRHAQAKLGLSFSETELKTVWRKAALKTHPDRFAGEDQMKQVRMAVIFRELCEAYELLQSAIENFTVQAA